MPDGSNGGWQVKLQPGAEAALPDAEEFMEREMKEQDLLPPRIENPRSQRLDASNRGLQVRREGGARG